MTLTERLQEMLVKLSASNTTDIETLQEAIIELQRPILKTKLSLKVEAGVTRTELGDRLLHYGMDMKDDNPEMAKDILRAVQELQERDRNATEMHILAERLKETSRAAYFYEAILEAIKDDEMLQDAWIQFIMTLKLRVEKQIPGLTEPLG